jgi:hypothetical protein
MISPGERLRAIQGKARARVAHRGVLIFWFFWIKPKERIRTQHLDNHSKSSGNPITLPNSDA